MTVDRIGPSRQVLHADTLTSLQVEDGIRPGMTAVVDSDGTRTCVRYTAIPAGTLPVDSPHVVNDSRGVVQFADDSAMVDLVGYTNAGIVPATPTNNQVFMVKPIVGFGWSKIDNAQIDTSAAIGVTKLALGSAGTVLSSDGSTNAFRTCAILGINTGSGTQNYLPKYTETGTELGNSVFVDDGTFAYVTRNGTGAADSPLDWAQFAVRGATDPTLRTVVAFDTTRNVGLIQAGKSGTGELPLVINPKGAFVGVGNTSPLSTLNVTADGAGISGGVSAIDGGSQFVINGKTDGNKRLAFRLDTTSNVASIQAGKSGVGSYPIVFDSNIGIGNTSPLSALNVTADGAGISGGVSPIDGGAQLIINGKTDATKRFAFRLDTASNVASVQAGKIGVGSYPISFISNVGFGGITDPSTNVDTNSFRMRTGAAAGRFIVSDANGAASWSNSLSGLTGLTFDSSAANPLISQTDTSEVAANSLLVSAQNSISESGYGGSVRIAGGAGSNASSGKVSSGTAGVVRIVADGDSAVAQFGTDMVLVEAPLVVHGSSQIDNPSYESHVISRIAGFTLKEDVRWFQKSQSSTAPFSFDIPTGMDGTWTTVYTIYTSGLDTIHIAGAVFARSSGTLTWSNAFTVFNGIPGSIAFSASSDNMRITITPPSAASIKWTIKSVIVLT